MFSDYSLPKNVYFSLKNTVHTIILFNFATDIHLFSEPVRLLSKSTEKVKQTQHRDSEELDHSEPSSYQQKHLIPCYRKNPFRDKTRKIRSDHRQGLKIRSSNVLSQPEFVGCSVLTALSLCIKDFTLTPRLHIFMVGFILELLKKFIHDGKTSFLS